MKNLCENDYDRRASPKTNLRIAQLLCWLCINITLQSEWKCIVVFV
jgi:hypothetical protein